MASSYPFLTSFSGGVRLAVRAKPGLSRARGARIVEIGEGQQAVEVTVAAAPEGGKANKAILAQLAEALDLKKKALDLKSGASGRLKIVEISGDPDELLQRVQAWLRSL